MDIPITAIVTGAIFAFLVIVYDATQGWLH